MFARPDLFCKRLMIATSLYSGVRKAIILRDAKVDCYNWEKREREHVPMLSSTKLAITLSSVVLGQGFWPFWLYSDIQMLEIKMRGLDKKKYGYRDIPNSFEYIFS